MFSIKKAKLKGLMNEKILETEMTFLGHNDKTFKKTYTVNPSTLHDEEHSDEK